MKRRQLINDYATRQVPSTIGWAVYEQAGPGRILGSGRSVRGRVGTGLLHVGPGFVGPGRAGF